MDHVVKEGRPELGSGRPSLVGLSFAEPRFELTVPSALPTRLLAEKDALAAEFGRGVLFMPINRNGQ